MQAEELIGLLDAYGADPARWPERQREAMHAALAEHPELAARRREAADLDQWLDSYSVARFDLGERILDAIPETPLERLLRWLLPAEPGLWWRPAMAAAMPLIVGVAIGLGGTLATTTTTDWSAQEQALLGALEGDSWYD
jgi:hypothetical protein